MNPNAADNAAAQECKSSLQTPPGVMRFVWPLVIFLVALAVRAIYLFQVQSCPFFGHEIMDAAFHREWGLAVAAGERFMEGPYFRGPLYPWLLGMIYWAFGDGNLAPRIIQIIIGSLNCVLVYLIGCLAFERRVGILAGFAAATYWLFPYFESELLVVTLVVFLDLVLLSLLLHAGRKDRWWLWLLSGIALGVSAVARPSILIFVPVVALWLVMLYYAQWRRLLGFGASLAVGMIVTIAPVTIRNAVVGHDRVLVSSTAGVNFFIGNNPQSDGMSAIVPGTPAEFWPGIEAQNQRAEEAAGHPLKASEISAYYFDQAFAFFRAQPQAAAANLLKKLGYFWSHWEVSNNQDIRFVTGNFAPITRFLPLSFAIVAPLGLLGLLLSLRRSRTLLPLWGFVVSYMLGVVAFFVTARYRLPVVPILIVLAAFATCWIIDQLRTRRWSAIVGAAVIVAAGGLLAARIPPGVEVGLAQSYGSAGIVLLEQGKIAEGDAYLEKALQLYEAQPKILHAYGTSRMQQGDYARAEQCFRKLVVLEPTHPEGLKHLGFVLARQSKLAEAITAFRQALKLFPDDAKLHANLGGVLIQTGQVDDGLAELQRGVTLDDQFIAHYEQIATGLAQQRRFADAKRVLEAGLEAAPDRPGLLIWLSKLLGTCPDASVRDPQRSLKLAEHACLTTDSRDANALDALAAAQSATGMHSEALETAQHAALLAQQTGNLQLARQIQARMRYYQAQMEAQSSEESEEDNPAP